MVEWSPAETPAQPGRSRQAAEAVGDPVDVDFGELVEVALPGWSVQRPVQGDPTGPVWVHATPPTKPPLPPQGWKLHVSATVTSAIEVLDRVMAVLDPMGVAFKVAWNGAFLARLNSGLEGASQVGKFITVYPPTDAAAVEVAIGLCEATSGLAGPAVPSDRRIGSSPVHYRYGSFANLHIQNALGQPELGLIAPGGARHPDRRGMTYRPPDWVEDPFEEAGLATGSAPRRHVVDGRFVALAPIAVGARGSVHRGVDLQEGARVVLKFAAVDAAVGRDGRDAAARLRHEAAMLEELPSMCGAPGLVAVGTWDGQCYVAMEDIVGRAASWYVHTAQLEGRCLTQATILAWAVDLAKALRAMHGCGHVHRDLKLSNVMIEEQTGRARLIDFELASPIGAPAPDSAGSRGYRPPSLPNAVVTPADDVFGFGALLWALATTAEPSFQPVEGDLERLDAMVLNPDADGAVLGLSRRCRAAEPSQRPCMDEVVATLELIEGMGGTGGSGRIEGVAGTAALEHLEDIRGTSGAGRIEGEPIWRDLAIRAGRALVARAVQVDGRPVWPSVRRIGGGIALRTIYEGSAGIALAFCELVAAGEDEFREPLKASLDWVVHSDDFVDHVPGLVSGEMGVAVACAVAGRLLDDESLVEAADAIAFGLPAVDGSGPDYVMGAAGIARGHLALAGLTGSGDHLARARVAARQLIDSAERDGDGAFWRLPMDVPRLGGEACYGYGHGAAGIADVLIDLADVLGDEACAELADDALDWVAAGVIERIGGGVDWPETPDKDPFGAWWCHGAGGIAMVLARSGRHDLARRAARQTARMTWAMPCRCHGLAGNVEVLAVVGRLLDDDEFRRAASGLGRVLAGWEIAPGVWPGESAEVVTPDYMVGTAGVIPAFLRLEGIPAVDPTFVSTAGLPESDADHRR